MPLSDKNGWYPSEVVALLFDERLSAAAKLLVWFLAISPDGEQISQEELSSVLSTNSRSDTARRAIEDAERIGYIEVDRTVRPFWYRVK